MRNMNDLVRQAGVMQNKIAKMQQEMAERTVEASSGGGMVKVVATCKQDIVSITIDPKALEGGDVEMLQDLVDPARQRSRPYRTRHDGPRSQRHHRRHQVARHHLRVLGKERRHLSKERLPPHPPHPPPPPKAFAFLGRGGAKDIRFALGGLPVARRPTVDGGLSRP